MGNLSFGGTGKTPFIISLCKILEKRGQRALVLSRGYKGPFENTSRLVSEISSDSFIGDEAELMRRNTTAEIILGKKRLKNFKEHSSKLDFDCVILDDGFQHLEICRDLDIVLLDTNLDQKSFFCPPIGYLRESAQALDKDTLVFLTKTRTATSKKIQFYESFNPLEKIDFLHVGYYCAGKEIKNISREIIVFSSIANPQKFAIDLEKSGFIVSKHFEFSDHHEVTQEEFSEILNYSKHFKLPIICTEKDFVKIERFEGSNRIIIKKVGFDENLILSSLGPYLKRLKL